MTNRTQIIKMTGRALRKKIGLPESQTAYCRHTRKMFALVALILTCALCMGGLSGCTENRWQLAEGIALADPDSAVSSLASADMTRMSEGERALYTLTQALALEEMWQREHADTAVYLFDNEDDWAFKRKTSTERVETDEALASMMADSSLIRAYHYYEDKSLGGVTDNKKALRRFGRICYVLSRQYQDEDSLLQADQLYLLAIHCAEACGDDEIAYRAYHQWSRHLLNVHGSARIHAAYHCLRQALMYFYRCHNNDKWMLTLVNDYGWIYLSLLPLNPRNFPTIIHAANLAYQGEDKTEDMYESVANLIDSVENAPVLPFNSHTIQYTTTYDTKDLVREHSVPKGLFMDAEQIYMDEVEKGVAHLSMKSLQDKFQTDIRQAITQQQVQTRTYLAAGYARKAAVLQSRLLWAVIACLVLAVMLLLLIFWNWRGRIQRNRQAERLEHEMKLERLSTQLKQKETLIASLRGHIIDKSEIQEMLKPTAGKRTVINARDWREIEVTLDVADDQFVSRLRAGHPSFSEEDIRLCMMVRLKLSNAALSAIYSISVSAVQHRKQKLKKEGFGVNDPSVTLDHIIEGY